MISSFAFVYEHESSIGGYKGPTMFRGEHDSSICGYKGPTMYGVSMKAQFVVIRVLEVFCML